MSATLIEFQADWCGPCKQQKPIVEEIDEEYDDVEVEFVDIEEDGERAQKYSVSSLPTLVLLDEDGEVSDRFVGLTQKADLADALDAL